MRHFFVALGVCALLVFSFPSSSAVKNECCPIHFQILRAYQESMQDLVKKVKAESLEEFENRYHGKEALTYLDLLHGALDDIVTHYKELNCADDGAATREVMEKADKLWKQLKAAKGAEAKKLVESMEVTLEVTNKSAASK